MPARLPDFLGLGTQKGGTTTLHQLLLQHPAVFLPTAKEIHYFDLQPHETPDWYRQHFKPAKPDQCCGEITPFYLFHPAAPKRIQALLPNVKLVVLLRDPVERALSQIFHARRHGFENLSPAEAIAAESERLAGGDLMIMQKHSYLARSRYLEQLDRYETLFPPAQLLVLQSEALFRQPQTIWNTLQCFLGLQTIPLPTLPVANAGNGESSSVDPGLRSELRSMLATTASGVRERYGFGWDWA